MKRINIGCGNDIKEGWINLDMHDKHGADCIFNLEDIYKGEKLPFPDNHFDYIYCSHVIEDFIDPIVLIREFIRICKVGGYLEIKVPSEGTANLGNIHHKSIFTLIKLRSIAEEENHYGENYSLKIKELSYYAIKNYRKKPLINKGKLYCLYLWLNEKFYNAIGYRIVETTFLKYLTCCVHCKAIYEKLDAPVSAHETGGKE